MSDKAAWWGVEHSCGGVERVFPTLHWADEPEVGAGPRRALACDACGERYLFTFEAERSAGAGYGGLIAVAEAAKREGWPLHCATRTTCSEHIAEGDDQKDNWAFGLAHERSAGAAPPAPITDISVLSIPDLTAEEADAFDAAMAQSDGAAPLDVERLGLSDEQTAVLRNHLASRDQTISEFLGDLLMEAGLGRATGKDYPAPARLSEGIDR